MSYSVTANISGFDNVAAELKAKVASVLFEAVRFGAAEERAHKTYQNRTGQLQKSTIGRMVRNSAADMRAEIAITREYASYVRDLGFMTLETTVRDTSNRIRNALR